MASVGEMIDEEIPDNPVEQGEQAGKQVNQGEQVQHQSSNGIVDLLTAESPNKPVESYMDSSVNIFGTEWFARILRGAEGILGEGFADYAVFDILRGSYEGFFKSKDTGEKETGDIVEVNADEPEN